MIDRAVRVAACALPARVADASAAVALVLLAVDPGTALRNAALAGVANPLGGRTVLVLCAAVTACGVAATLRRA